MSQQSATEHSVEQVLLEQFGSAAQLSNAFKAVAAKLPTDCQCTLVIPPERYMVVQIDKPAVPDEEISLALPWTIKDLVTLPDDDMVLDYLDLPLQNQLQGIKVNVVVSSKSWLADLVALFVANKLQLVSIQPEEWLARNLLPAKEQAQMLVSHQPGQDLTVQILQQGNLCFSRRLRGFNRLDQFSLEELQLGPFDNLLLELQRSIDYFEGQLKQAPVKEIALLFARSDQDDVVQLFVQNGFSQVFRLSAKQAGVEMTAEQFSLYWVALAAAIEPLCARREVNLEAAG
ncbi:MSHA biogenesis protein MshI [Rheinheimera sediminis]|uniref:MSHA biogenesis protein MshI n=1 Tax=Rheinheimera sp. YQF-1 TaxID=2499626 RepID=UPI000FD94BF8|nr:MSHA biogenesis protein MshI [Rheinheimera sp. YQF-1]RVT45963.1 MSHA biogenesis protein MshI [Rheinheimera sp. YQF-1]